jgi:hypothetical protein
MNIIYEDERVLCDDEGITIKGYYQPLDDDKKILYREINSLKLKRINPFAGLSQIWGNGDSSLQGSNDTNHYWFAFDFKRLFRSKAIVIDDGNLMKTATTPEDIELVFQILKEKSLIAQNKIKN